MIGVVTEGHSDKNAVREICKKAGIAVKIRKMDKNNLRKGKRYAELLLSGGCRKVVVLKDLHSFTASDIERAFDEMQFGDKVKLCIAIRTIESWLLADEKALSNYLGSEINPINNPEEISEPAELLDELLRKTKGRPYYKGGTDSAEIAKRLRLKVVEKKCPSFREFIAAVEG